MTDRNEWDIKRLQEWKAEVVSKLQEQDKWNREVATFKDTTVQQLIVIFDKLKELHEGDKWLKRMFTTALVGTGVSALGALIVWAFQN